MGDRTVLSRATSNSRSLRATVPIGIVTHFGLKEGDSLDWRLEIRNSRLTIEVSPIRNNSGVANDGTNCTRQRRLVSKPASVNSNDDSSGRRRWGLIQKE